MSRNYIGPALPPHLIKRNSEDDAAQILPSSSSDDVYGPSLPPGLQSTATFVHYSDEDDDAYGPLPDGVAGTRAHRALEERALELKLEYLDHNRKDDKVREEWMLELPEVGASKLGLGPRQFRKNAGPDFSDRSSWTDTPRSKKQKKQEDVVDLKEEALLKSSQNYDEEQADISKRHQSKSKRDKSLLEMHQDKLKKKKAKDADGEPTRRPFSRDIDLKVNHFDDAQKKSIMKKAMHLDDRFSRGQSKFL